MAETFDRDGVKTLLNALRHFTDPSGFWLINALQGVLYPTIMMPNPDVEYIKRNVKPLRDLVSLGGQGIIDQIEQLLASATIISEPPPPPPPSIPRSKSIMCEITYGIFSDTVMVGSPPIALIDSLALGQLENIFRIVTSPPWTAVDGTSHCPNFELIKAHVWVYDFDIRNFIFDIYRERIISHAHRGRWISNPERRKEFLTLMCHIWNFGRAPTFNNLFRMSEEQAFVKIVEAVMKVEGVSVFADPHYDPNGEQLPMP